MSTSHLAHHNANPVIEPIRTRSEEPVHDKEIARLRERVSELEGERPYLIQGYRDQREDAARLRDIITRAWSELNVGTQEKTIEILGEAFAKKEN